MRRRGRRLRPGTGPVVERHREPDGDPRLRIEGAGGRRGHRPAGVGHGDPPSRPRGRHHDALRRRLRAVDRRALGNRERRAAPRLVLLRERGRVAGRGGGLSAARRLPRLVGLPGLDRRDARAGGGRLLARAVRARVPGTALDRASGLPDRRARLRHGHWPTGGCGCPGSWLRPALDHAGHRSVERDPEGNPREPARRGTRPKRRLRPLRGHQEAFAGSAKSAGSARREHWQGRRADCSPAARGRAADLGGDRNRLKGSSGRREPAGS